MNDDASPDLRSFAVLGHASAGKTMSAEAILACSGRIGRIGNIAAGTTASDYHASEKEHQISVHCTLLNTEWIGEKFNILDTPGYSDFISEGLGALRVGDFALIVINVAHGLGAGTDAVWDYATRFGLPKILVVNGLDKANVNFETVVEDARVHFGKNVFPLAIPLNAGPGFSHELDVMRNEVISFVSGQGEIHLQVIVERLARRFGVQVALEEPLVPYRETIRACGDSRYHHKKQTGGAGQFAEVWLRVEPAARDSGIDFQQTLVGTNVDRVFVPSVEKGAHTACREGIFAGFRVTDLKAEFYDGEMHPVDSKDIAFQVAGYHAFKEAFQAAAPHSGELGEAILPEDHGFAMEEYTYEAGHRIEVAVHDTHDSNSHIFTDLDSDHRVKIPPQKYRRI
ncbi:MAG: GTP-binding protein [Opitutus sp.]|nr:GTP-binding protein [Opitutus sp.]